ncbi:MAG: PilZ domain-containing protein [Acidobacteria bacterium]|nr:PilZ domain-containing protein [Acidobacteriota bacterium]
MSEANRRSSERRRVPRIKVDFPVTVNWGRRQYKWQAVEFSEYGILLVAPHKELVGQEISIQLTLEPPDTPLALQGMVVYSIAAGLGVRFKNVSMQQQAILTHYVQQRGIGIAKPSGTKGKQPSV